MEWNGISIRFGFRFRFRFRFKCIWFCSRSHQHTHTQRERTNGTQKDRNFEAVRGRHIYRILFECSCVHVSVSSSIFLWIAPLFCIFSIFTQHNLLSLCPPPPKKKSDAYEYIYKRQFSRSPFAIFHCDCFIYAATQWLKLLQFGMCECMHYIKISIHLYLWGENCVFAAQTHAHTYVRLMHKYLELKLNGDMKCSASLPSQSVEAAAAAEQVWLVG